MEIHAKDITPNLLLWGIDKKVPRKVYGLRSSATKADRKALGNYKRDSNTLKGAQSSVARILNQKTTAANRNHIVEMISSAKRNGIGHFDGIEQQMPLLMNSVSSAQRKLAGHRIVMQLHIIRDVGPLVQAFIQSGAEVSFIPETYSAKPEYLSYWVKMKQAYPENLVFYENPKDALRHATSNKPVLVLSHRGEPLHSIANNTRLFDAQIKGASIHTQTGKNLAGILAETNFPIIPIYESRIKKHEIVAVADSVIQVLSSMVTLQGSLALIGHGGLGYELATRLGNRMRLRAYDVDSVAAYLAYSRGAFVSSRISAVISDADIVIIAASANPLADPSGPYVLTGKELQYVKDRAVIVNAGSPYAVDIGYLERNAMRLEDWLEQVHGRRVGTIYRLFDGRRIGLLADGYPVNLALGSGILPQQFDPVATLVFEVAIELAKGNLSPGIQSYEPVIRSIDERIAQRFLKLLDGGNLNGNGF
jgi:S-adenosylhomocysteine hydrolase